MVSDQIYSLTCLIQSYSAQCGMWYRWKSESNQSAVNEANTLERQSTSMNRLGVATSKKRRLDQGNNESVVSFKRVRMLPKTPITW